MARKRLFLRLLLLAGLLLAGVCVAAWLAVRPAPVPQLTPAESAERAAIFGGPAASPPALYSGATRTSPTLTMRDGTRIAVDLWLPEGLGRNSRVPTLLMATRYWRRIGLVWPFSLLDQPPEEVRFFTAHGYAVVRMDVRGTGASGGSRAYPWSPVEREDTREVLDWIVSKDWSNGRVATLGISYAGTAAEFAAALGDPALRAVMPMFSVYDAFSDIAFPGGVRNDRFIYSWGQANSILDSGHLPHGTPWWLRAVVTGPARAGGETPEEQAADRKQHEANGDIYANALSVTFRDDVARPAGISIDAFSPHAFRAETEAAHVPFYVWAGWFDGAYADAALKRYASLHVPQRLVIGPWNHGAAEAVDPITREKGMPPNEAERLFERLRFFDHYLKDEGPAPKNEIVYYTLGGGGWRHTDVWPPAGTAERVLGLGQDGAMVWNPADAKSGSRTYAVDFSVGSGPQNRWHTQLDRDDVAYPDRASVDARLLVFESAPLDEATEISGWPRLHLLLAASSEDTAVHAYLEAVSPKGRVVMLSEGVLRALHRAGVSMGGTGRAFLRRDAAPMVPGRPETLDVRFLPLSAVVPAGWRVRLALAGADADQFARVPPVGEVTWTVFTGGDKGSRLYLPITPQ